MSKYCPAGNIECECATKQDDGAIWCVAKSYGLDITLRNIEVCPYPSKQKPVVKHIECNCVHKRVNDAPFLIVYPQKECQVHGKYHGTSI